MRKVANDSGMKKRILFIISDTGGGHRSAANAVIRKALNTNKPTVNEAEIMLRPEAANA